MGASRERGAIGAAARLRRAPSCPRVRASPAVLQSGDCPGLLGSRRPPNDVDAYRRDDPGGHGKGSGSECSDPE